MNARDLLIRLTARDEASKTLQGFQDRARNMGRSMQNTGKQMTKGLTVPILGAAAAVGKIGADFESSMSRVSAVTGATSGEMDELSTMAQELGRTTQFSASQAGEAMGFLGQAGFDANEMMESLPDTLDLAAAGQLELAQAADISSNVLQGFGMDAEEMSRVTDVMAATASSANTSVEQMGQAMSMVAPLAKSSGVSLEETSAAMGALGDAGIQGTRAGTTLRQTLSALESPSGAAADAIEDLGLKTHDSEGMMLPLTDIVGQLEEKGLSTADAMDIFGQRAGPGMAALVERGSDSLSELTGELENSEGRAGDMADEMMDNVQGAFLEAKSAFEGFAISIFTSGFGDFLTDALDKVQTGLQKATEWWESLSGETKMFIGIVAAVVAAAGPLLTILGTASIIIGAISAPILIAVAAFAALAAGVAAIVIWWDEIVAFMQPVINTFKIIGMMLWEMLKPAFTSFVQSIKQLWNALLQLWNFIAPVLIPILKVLGAIIGLIIIGAIMAVVGIFRLFMAILSSVISFIANWITSVIKFWQNWWDGTKEAISAIGSFFTETLPEFLGKALKTVANWIGNIVSFYLELPGRVMNAVWNLLRRIGSFFSDIASTMIDRVSRGISNIIDFFRELPGKVLDFAGKFLDAGKGLIDSIIDGIKNKAQNVKDTVTDVLDSARDLLPFSDAKEGPLSDLTASGERFSDTFAEGIERSAGNLEDKAKQALRGAANAQVDVSNGSDNSPVTSLAERQPTVVNNNGNGEGGKRVNLNVQLEVKVGMYAGHQSEKNAIASELWNTIVDVARQQGGVDLSNQERLR